MFRTAIVLVAILVSGCTPIDQNSFVPVAGFVHPVPQIQAYAECRAEALRDMNNKPGDHLADALMIRTTITDCMEGKGYARGDQQTDTDVIVASAPPPAAPQAKSQPTPIETGAEMGLRLLPATDHLASMAVIGLDKPRGLFTAGINPNDPAARAGIQVGDIILAVNGQEITTTDEMRALLAKTAPGQTLKIDVWHQFHKVSLTVNL